MSITPIRALVLLFAGMAATISIARGQDIPPLPSITIADFAASNESFTINTANAAGIKTFWVGKLSIKSNGTITGSATVETYAADGALTSSQKVSISSGSRVFLPTKLYVPQKYVKPLNYRLTNNYYGGPGKLQEADYHADIIIRFSNQFVARGKIIYEHALYLYPIYPTAPPPITHTNPGEGSTITMQAPTTTPVTYNSDDESEISVNLSVTGPKGHIGFYND